MPNYGTKLIKISKVYPKLNYSKPSSKPNAYNSTKTSCNKSNPHTTISFNHQSQFLIIPYSQPTPSYPIKISYISSIKVNNMLSCTHYILLVCLHISVYLIIYLLSYVYLFVHLSICLFTYLYEHAHIYVSSACM